MVCTWFYKCFNIPNINHYPKLFGILIVSIIIISLLLFLLLLLLLLLLFISNWLEFAYICGYVSVDQVSRYCNGVFHCLVLIRWKRGACIWTHKKVPCKAMIFETYKMLSIDLYNRYFNQISNLNGRYADKPKSLLTVKKYVLHVILECCKQRAIY